MRIPGPLQFALSTIAAYLVLKVPGLVAQAPVPSSLVTLYMFFAVVVILLAMTATEAGTERLFGPVKRLFAEPGRERTRYTVIFAVAAAAALMTYANLRPSYEAPVLARTVHPAPPRTMDAYGRTFDLSTLENPLRRLEKDDPQRFEEYVRQGGTIYFRNCFFCHGPKLDGRGHLAKGLDPAPLPFAGTDTIAQLSESYLFWRIVKGGRGLPEESRPALSSMPAWEGYLKEDEVWKVILFLYEYTGNTPRRWKEEEG